MHETPPNELAEAIARLTSVHADLKAREAAFARDAASLTKERKGYLVDTAARLLPELSGGTLSNLLREVPDFVTAVVRRAFAENRKILGLFAGRDYRRAVQLTQARLASHLDQVKFGELEGLDIRIVDLTARRTAIEAKSREVAELLSLLQGAAQQGVPMRDDVKSLLQRLMAELGASERARLRGARAPAPVRARDERSGESSDDFADLWIFWATDIPTSLRTLLLAGIAEHRPTGYVGDEGAFGGGGASGSWDVGSPQTPINAAEGAAAAVAGAVVADAMSASLTTAGVGTDSVPTADTVIATDDSLGYFS